jgi:hypothetical protein
LRALSSPEKFSNTPQKKFDGLSIFFFKGDISMDWLPFFYSLSVFVGTLLVALEVFFAHHAEARGRKLRNLSAELNTLVDASYEKNDRRFYVLMESLNGNRSRFELESRADNLGEEGLSAYVQGSRQAINENIQQVLSKRMLAVTRAEKLFSPRMLCIRRWLLPFGVLLITIGSVAQLSKLAPL